eukprot:TRINITY_DN4610_c0_g1_i9.p2 TRINITY_DN4610_c0_g1~~TRINITY_DN4610_c0_g1_i9.p2  ORF type:complete len:190 (+),score=-15.60 TRINITY_DN4610_c0_g1_i9:912-1481(+)
MFFQQISIFILIILILLALDAFNTQNNITSKYIFQNLDFCGDSNLSINFNYCCHFFTTNVLVIFLLVCFYSIVVFFQICCNLRYFLRLYCCRWLYFFTICEILRNKCYCFLSLEYILQFDILYGVHMILILYYSKQQNELIVDYTCVSNDPNHQLVHCFFPSSGSRGNNLQILMLEKEDCSYCCKGIFV